MTYNDRPKDPMADLYDWMVDVWGDDLQPTPKQQPADIAAARSQEMGSMYDLPLPRQEYVVAHSATDEGVLTLDHLLS